MLSGKLQPQMDLMNFLILPKPNQLHLLEYLPKFSLAVVMIFTGWKMMLGLVHVAYQGQYALILAILCALLVFRLGIFEGLLLALLLHGSVNFIVFSQVQHIKTLAIIKKYLQRFAGGGGAD